MVNSGEKSKEAQSETNHPNEKASEPDKHIRTNSEKLTKSMSACDPSTFFMAFFTGVIAFSSLLTFGAICFQAWIYNCQLKEMQKSSDAATRAANSAEATVRQAEANLHLDQRAWVAIADIVGFPKTGEIFRPQIWLTNTGRTFAKNVVTVATSDPFPTDEIPDFAQKIKESAGRRNQNNISHGLIPPNGRLQLAMEPRENRVVTEEDHQVIKGGRKNYFMFGQTTYGDIFGDSHWLIFCVFLSYNPLQPENGGWSWSVYKEYNDTGDGKPPWQY